MLLQDASKKKRKGQFSDYYNFVCELTKRLKMRIKENKKHYKFRKHKDDIKEMKQEARQMQIEKMREVGNIKRKRGRPRKIESVKN